jgi:hypothetical protein
MVNTSLTTFSYDAYGVLNQITKSDGTTLGFNFDLLGRLRNYDTSSRHSTFDFDGTKRYGDFDGSSNLWKRYHWCKRQFLGYKDDTNTYYIVPDLFGSPRVIFTHAGSVVNRLDYDSLGNLRNKTTDPQVEIGWRDLMRIAELDIYVAQKGLYFPLLGKAFSQKSPLTDYPESNIAFTGIFVQEPQECLVALLPFIVVGAALFIVGGGLWTIATVAGGSYNQIGARCQSAIDVAFNCWVSYHLHPSIGAAANCASLTESAHAVCGSGM